MPDAPAEPITLADAKLHLRVDATAEDALITQAIIDARAWVEDYTGLLLVRREVTERLSHFTRQTRLRAWPVAADQPVTIVYRDTAGVVQTIADAEIRAISRPGVIYPAAGARWPAASTLGSDIDVTFTAGYSDAADVPPALKRAILVMLTAFYEDREGGELFAAAEKSARSICGKYKRRTL